MHKSLGLLQVNDTIKCSIPVNALFPCRFWWALKFAAVVYVLLQPSTSHLNGFWPVCLHMWTLRLLPAVNALLHPSNKTHIHKLNKIILRLIILRQILDLREEDLTYGPPKVVPCRRGGGGVPGTSFPFKSRSWEMWFLAFWGQVVCYVLFFFLI